MQTVTLIIDKRRELSVKYKKLLENEHSKVIISKNLISALKTIQDTEPDLILISDSIDSDISDYCKKIRALTYNMRPIIVALSKSAETNDRINALESGADDFISEPVNSEEFLMRIKAHLRREFESNLDSKKILPNKNYSLRSIKRAVTSRKDWACLYITIENFKNYRETYTELASDKLLKTYSAIITSALNGEDFLGSFSEEGFLVITDSYKAEKLANFLIFAFDTVVRKFYSKEDLQRGYIMMHGDEQAGRRSGFMHTIIGIVSSEIKEFSRVDEVTSAVINVHNIAKLAGKSNYLSERMRLAGEDSILEKSYNNRVLIIEPDDSMVVLLSTILDMQGYKVETVSNFNKMTVSSQTPAVIIFDTGKDELRTGLEICGLIRNDENYKNSKLIVTSIFHDKESVLNAGADLYLPKPYEIFGMVKWVEKLVEEFNG